MPTDRDLPRFRSRSVLRARRTADPPLWVRNYRAPPVNAFWSATLYDPDSFFVENPIHRYAISSWMPLERNSDGSLDIYIQQNSPGGDKEANWLPAPAGGFNVTMRLYWPKDHSPSILDGSWKPPGLTRAPE